MEKIFSKKNIVSFGTMFLTSFLLHALFAWACIEGLFPGQNLSQLFFIICLVEAMVVGIANGIYGPIWMDEDLSEQTTIKYGTLSGFFLIGASMGLSFMAEQITITPAPCFLIGACASLIFAYVFGVVAFFSGILFRWIMEVSVSMTEKLLSRWIRRAKKVRPSSR